MVNKHEKWLQACDHMAQLFSTCSKKQYAAFILAPNNRVVGFGYNGSPPGHPHCNQGGCPRLTEQSSPGTTYDNCIANHAEANALLWSDSISRQDGTLIINGPPCFGCCKLIASSGISNPSCFCAFITAIQNSRSSTTRPSADQMDLISEDA